MLLLIDNYDSFTWNLVHALGNTDILVRRNDALSVKEALDMKPRAILLSPGPCAPDSAGICLDLVRQAAGTVPVLGVCLGHQAIGQAFGAKVVRCHEIMHGKLSAIHHQSSGIFAGVPQDFKATRYHSLVVERETLPSCLEVIAETQDGVIMGLSHREYCIHGVQFHPESIFSAHGPEILRNFLDMAGVC